MTIRLQQNTHGSYTIFPVGKTAHSATAWITRNEKGGGYTLRMKDGRTAFLNCIPRVKTWVELERQISNIITQKMEAE